MMKLGFKKVHPDAVLPKYAHQGDAGMDVCAVEDVVLWPFTPTLVKTGLVAEIPDGYELQVRPRSGLALKKGITVFNGTGTIDAGYRSEIGIILLWVPRCVFSSTPERLIRVRVEEPSVQKIQKGDRVAQLVLATVTRALTEEVSEVSVTERGAGGFGHTGV